MPKKHAIEHKRNMVKQRQSDTVKLTPQKEKLPSKSPALLGLMRKMYYWSKIIKLIQNISETYAVWSNAVK